MNPLQKQIAGYALALVVVLVVLYFVYSEFKGGIAGIFQGEGPTSVVNADNPLPENAANLSYPSHQYEVFADGIYEAFNTTGSNWSAVLAIFEQMNTADDVAALVNAYGVRTLYVFAVATAPANLPQALIREGSMSWYDVGDVNEILRNKGINFQF
jgi:hypothetical protein